MVERLLAAGSQVVAVDLPGVHCPAGTESIPTDLGCSAAVRQLAQAVGGADNPLHGLVHCAGITRDGVLWKLSDEDWDDVMRVNLSSSFYLLREMIPLMRERGGAITLISSINGERGKFGQGNYAASKAGLIGLARTAAREGGRFDIRVNVIAPGLIQTSMTKELPAKVTEAALQESVLGRLGTAEDVAGVALFLCSQLARHVTGQVLRVDGGQLIA